ncbi:MAG: DUF2322 family protein [Thiobacillaceae bacterium]|jgi:hypothetical protein|nr:DUF2322 family protein [Thiobacillaceae bacterium]
MALADTLAALPATDHLARLVLTGPDGRREVIENRPGSQGSVRIYAYLAGKHGAIDARAAAEGIDLYAEHAEEARAQPGRHPNIDRLLAILRGGGAWRVEILAA